MFRRPDPKDQMRQQQRALKRTNRDLEKDRHSLERQEKQLEAEIKKAAKRGDKQTCAVYALSLIHI